MSRNELESRVAAFCSRPQTKTALDELQRRLPTECSIYLVGGAIRNLAIEALHGYRPRIGDLDLFVDGIGREAALSEYLPESDVAITDLGGIRWSPPGCPYDLDICLLRDFVILAKVNLPPSIENLLASIDFTANALVYDLKEARLAERKAIADIHKRRLAFNTRIFYTRLATCYRALLLGHKTGFVFAEEVFHFLCREVDLETVEEARHLLQARHGKELSRRILKEYDRVCTRGSYEEYVAGRAEK